MTDAERPTDATPVPRRAGERLRIAREASGLSLPEVAARTRVPLRHLEALEASDYSGLPSPTYAVGFARAYARTVGEDEVATAAQVRDEVAQSGARPAEYEPYVTADPARLPSRGLAIVAAGVALALVVLAALYFGASQWQRTSDPTAGAKAAPAAIAPVPAPSPAASAGTVRLTATGEVWMRVHDAAGTTLYLGTMKPGETFEVPAGADHPAVTVGRPDKLQITLDGAAVPALGSGDRPVKDAPLDAAALATRIGGATPGAAPTATPLPMPTTPVPTTPVPVAATRAAALQSSARRAARPRRVETETQRANRLSARAAAQGRPVPVPNAR